MSPPSNTATSDEQQPPPITPHATRSPAKHVTEATCDTHMPLSTKISMTSTGRVSKRRMTFDKVGLQVEVKVVEEDEVGAQEVAEAQDIQIIAQGVMMETTEETETETETQQDVETQEKTDTRDEKEMEMEAKTDKKRGETEKRQATQYRTFLPGMDYQ